MSQVSRITQNVFVFVIVFVFVFVFVNLFGHVMSSHHSEQMSQRSQVSRIALCMTKVKVNLSVSESVSQSIARILDPWNSRENQLDFFSLDHEKWFSISRSRLETRDWKKKFSFSSRSTRLKERISHSRLEKRDFHSNFSIKVDVIF